VNSHTFKVKFPGFFKVNFQAKGKENSLGAILDDIFLTRTHCGCDKSGEWLLKKLRRHLNNPRCGNRSELEQKLLEHIEEVLSDNSCQQQE
jgi:hypothetical protein